jgi:hypothetical protein
MQEGARPALANDLPPSASTIALSWLAMLAVDFFLHGGLLAPIYDWGSSFLLSPQDAFLRIPIAYVGLLVLAGGLVVLLARLGVDNARDGAVVGAAIGAVGWAAMLLGLWSISTAAAPLLVAWWASQTAELAVGGFVVGSVLGGAPRRRVVSRVAVLLAGAVLLTIVLQTLGYARAPVVVP